MYDFIHPLSDAFEGITHSLCTLEFENNRELYDWLLEALEWPQPRPHQYEFARLNVTYTVMSKRKLLQLVEEGRVDGWDDPRMYTLAGLRRRGYTPSAIRAFCERIGVAKAQSTVDVGLLEHSVREDLNFTAPRVLCVLRPLKVVIENYPEDVVEELDAPYWPHDVPREGSRKLPFSRELYIERDDFAELPPKGFHRLAPGREVRLRYAYFLRCREVVKDAAGAVTELRCTYDPETRGGSAPDGRKVAGTIHWVSAAQALPLEARLYDRLFSEERPDAGERTFLDCLNPGSLEVLADARIEPSVATAPPGSRFQFERQGYFYLEPEAAAQGRRVFNRIVTLRDPWAKSAARATAAGASGAGHEMLAEANGSRLGEAAVAAPAHSEEPTATGARDPLESVAPELRVAVEAIVARHGLTVEDARMVAGDPLLERLFAEAVAAGAPAQSVANWLVHELQRELKERGAATVAFGGTELAELVMLIDRGTLSATLGKRVLAGMLDGQGSPRAIIERQKLAQISDREELEATVDRVLAGETENVAAFRDGKSGLLGYFVGQVMKATRGRANPQLVNEILRQRLG